MTRHPVPAEEARAAILAGDAPQGLTVTGGLDLDGKCR